MVEPRFALVKDLQPQHYLTGKPNALPDEELIKNAFGESNYAEVSAVISSAAFLTSSSSL